MNLSKIIKHIITHYAEGKRAVLAGITGVSAENIRQYENGRTPSLEFIVALHRELGIDYYYILENGKQGAAVEKITLLEKMIADKEQIIALLSEKEKAER